MNRASRTSAALCALLLATLALAGCQSGDSGRGGDPGADGSSTDALAVELPALEDGPLTAEARRRIADLADPTGERVYEGYSALLRIGRDSVPALLEAVEGPYDDKVKINSLSLIGELGLAAVAAVPHLERLEITSSARIAPAVNQALRRIEQAAECGLPGLPADVEVHMVGQYKGQKELDIQLGDSGHIVTEIEVIVGSTTRPVALVLTAYDPVVWKVGTAGGSKLAGVLVSGYHTQALIGISDKVPHRVTSGEQSSGCEAFRATGSADVPGVEKHVVARTGHRIHQFHGASRGEGFLIGGSGVRPSNPRFSRDLSIDDYPVYRGEIPAGTRGLEELARQAKIRQATEADLKAWFDGSGEDAKGTHLRADGVYVVLEEITLPPGLYGAHSRVFIVPLGVPAPNGQKGHCSFLVMDGFSRE